MTDVPAALAGSAAAAAFVGLGAWLIGVNLTQSVFLVTAVLALAAGRAVLTLHDAAWTEDRLEDRPGVVIGGTRREVQELTWSLTGRRGTVTGNALRQLRQVAAHRLAGHGVDLDDPADAGAIERMVGSRALEVLLSDHDRTVRYRAFAHALDVVERLEPTAVTSRQGRP